MVQDIGLNGLGKGDEHPPPYAPLEYYSIFTYAVLQNVIKFLCTKFS